MRRIQQMKITQKTKKVISLILTATMLLLLFCGCGTASKPGDSGKAPVKTREEMIESVKGSTLNVMTWGAYIDWAIPEFEKLYGVTVNLDYYNSEQEAINKLKAGRLGTVDVVFLGSGHEIQAFNQEIIVEVDTSLLPSFKELYPFFQENARDTADGPAYKIPFAWGTNAFMYNADLIKEDITSWSAMYDPQYAGKLSLNDRAEMVYWYTCLALGIDINDSSDETMEKVRAELEEQIKLNKTLWSTGDDIVQYMMNDEIWIAHAYSGLAVTLQSQGKNIKYVIPEEGAQGWFDNLCLCKDAPNPDLAYLFIDYMISKDIQIGVAENVAYALTNKAAGDALSDELKVIVGMEDTENTLPALNLSEFLGVDWNTKVNQMWTEVKAGAGFN